MTGLAALSDAIRALDPTYRAHGELMGRAA